MKVTLYMAMSANGMIARQDDSTPWSDDEWQAYKDVVEKSDAIIIGRRTYEIMKVEELNRIGNPLTIILSSQNFLTDDARQIVVHTVEEAIKVLEERDCKSVLINGGGTLNSAIAKKDILDEVYLDIEPYLFGNGISLFVPNYFEYELELLGIKKLNENTIQLHYKVRK